MSYHTCIKSVSHIILLLQVYTMCQKCLQNKETMHRRLHKNSLLFKNPTSSWVYTILFSAWTIFSTALSLMQPERVLGTVIIHISNNIVSCTFSWLKGGLSWGKIHSWIIYGQKHKHCSTVQILNRLNDFFLFTLEIF